MNWNFSGSTGNHRCGQNRQRGVLYLRNAWCNEENEVLLRSGSGRADDGAAPEGLRVY